LKVIPLVSSNQGTGEERQVKLIKEL